MDEVELLKVFIHLRDEILIINVGENDTFLDILVRYVKNWANIDYDPFRYLLNDHNLPVFGCHIPKGHQMDQARQNNVMFNQELYSNERIASENGAGQVTIVLQLHDDIKEEIIANMDDQMVNILHQKIKFLNYLSYDPFDFLIFKGRKVQKMASPSWLGMTENFVNYISFDRIKYWNEGCRNDDSWSSGPESEISTLLCHGPWVGGNLSDTEPEDCGSQLSDFKLEYSDQSYFLREDNQLQDWGEINNPTSQHHNYSNPDPLYVDNYYSSIPGYISCDTNNFEENFQEFDNLNSMQPSFSLDERPEVIPVSDNCFGEVYGGSKDPFEMAGIANVRGLESFERDKESVHEIRQKSVTLNQLINDEDNKTWRDMMENTNTEVRVKLDWDVNEVYIVSAESDTKLKRGENWQSLSLLTPLMLLAVQVRSSLKSRNAQDSLYIQLELTFKDGSQESMDFYSEKNVRQLTGGRLVEIVTLYCSSLDSESNVWARFKPQGPLLQHSRENMVKIRITFHEGDFEDSQKLRKFKKDPICRLSMDSPCLDLERRLRKIVELKNPKERLIIFLNDEKFPNGFVYFYGFLTPRDMRISHDTTLFCLGLDDRQTFRNIRSWGEFETDGNLRFGATFRDYLQEITSELIPIRVDWDSHVFCNLPRQENINSRSTVILWNPDASMKEFERYLRTYLVCSSTYPTSRIYIELVKNGTQCFPFFGQLSPKELKLETKKTFLRVSVKTVIDPCWDKMKEEGTNTYGELVFGDYFDSYVVGQLESCLQLHRGSMSEERFIVQIQSYGLENKPLFLIEVNKNKFIRDLYDEVIGQLETIRSDEVWVMEHNRRILFTERTYLSVEGAGIVNNDLLIFFLENKEDYERCRGNLFDVVLRKWAVKSGLEEVENQTILKEESLKEWEENWLEGLVNEKGRAARESDVGGPKLLTQTEQEKKAVIEKKLKFAKMKQAKLRKLNKPNAREVVIHQDIINELRSVEQIAAEIEGKTLEVKKEKIKQVGPKRKNLKANQTSTVDDCLIQIKESQKGHNEDKDEQVIAIICGLPSTSNILENSSKPREKTEQTSEQKISSKLQSKSLFKFKTEDGDIENVTIVKKKIIVNGKVESSFHKVDRKEELCKILETSNFDAPRCPLPVKGMDDQANSVNMFKGSAMYSKGERGGQAEYTKKDKFLKEATTTMENSGDSEWLYQGSKTTKVINIKTLKQTFEDVNLVSRVDNPGSSDFKRVQSSNKTSQGLRKSPIMDVDNTLMIECKQEDQVGKILKSSSISRISSDENLGIHVGDNEHTQNNSGKKTFYNKRQSKSAKVQTKMCLNEPIGELHSSYKAKTEIKDDVSSVNSNINRQKLQPASDSTINNKESVRSDLLLSEEDHLEEVIFLSKFSSKVTSRRQRDSKRRSQYLSYRCQLDQTQPPLTLNQDYSPPPPNYRVKVAQP